MGQAASDSNLTLGAALPTTVESVQDDIFRHARFLTQIGALTYVELQTRLLLLNQLSSKCVDNEGHQLIFAIKRGTDKTVLWKGTVKIACVRVNFLTKQVISYRILTLSQFLKVFQALHSQFLAAEQSRENLGLLPIVMPIVYPETDFTTVSTNQEPTSSHRLTTPTDAEHLLIDIDKLDFASAVTQSQECLGECCICLERKPEVLLPCAHSYCLPCIEQWNVNHKTCPICRETLESTDDTWVISEAPGAQEICGSLMELSK